METAKARGVDVDALFHTLIAALPTPLDTPTDPQGDVDDWERNIDVLSDDIDPTLAPLPEEALSRESLYTERFLLRSMR